MTHVHMPNFVGFVFENCTEVYSKRFLVLANLCNTVMKAYSIPLIDGSVRLLSQIFKVCCFPAPKGKLGKETDAKCRVNEPAGEKFPSGWLRLQAGHSTEVKFLSKLSVHEILVVRAGWSLNRQVA